MTIVNGITILGLADFEGETVTAFVAGIDCGQRVVQFAQIEIPFQSDPGGLLTYHLLVQITALIRDSGYTIAPDLVLPIEGGHFEVPVVIGYPYKSRGQRLRPIEPGEAGTQAGPGLGKQRRVNKVAFLVNNTQGLMVGTDFDHLKPAEFRTPGKGTALTPTELYSGLAVQPVSDDSTYDGMVCWEIDGPYPGTVTAVGDFIETEDE